MNKKGQTAILILLLFFVLPIVVVGCNALGFGLNWAGKAAQVVSEQVDPRALLRKYEWFKDASAALDSKLATIKVMEVRLASIDKKTADRSDKEQMYVWMSEVSGIKASYNGLASEYNAQMAKINWAFCNRGSLPAGADVPLPREYKPYEVQ